MPEDQGLSNLGIGQQTQSSNASGGLKDILGSGTLMDEVGKSRTLSTQLSLAQASQPRSAIDFLSSPRGILTLLAAGGAIAAGGTAQNVGIGALLGTLQQAQQVQEGERTQKEAAIEQLTKQLDTSQSRQDKIRNQLQTIYNTNPEAFQGPGGVSPDPELLGFMLTGQTNLPMWTSTRRNLNMREKRWQERTDLLVGALEDADEPRAARQLTNVLLRHLGDPNPDEETVNALVNTYGTDDSETELMKMYMKEFGMSGRDASLFAMENALSFRDPAVLRLLSKPDDLTPAAKFKQTELDRFNFIEAWETDPTNAQQVLKIRSGAKDTLEAQRLVNDAAMASSDEFGGISAALINKTLGVKESTLDELQFQSILKGVTNRDNYMNTLLEDRMLEVLGMTKEEFRAGQVSTAQSEQADVKAGAQKSNAQWVSGQLDRIRAELSSTQAVGADITWYAGQADKLFAAAQLAAGIEVGSKEPLPPEAKERLRVSIDRLLIEARKQIETYNKQRQ